MHYHNVVAIVLPVWLAGGATACSPDQIRAVSPVTVTVGLQDADITGNDVKAIQRAVDQAAAAGGGTVLIKAGTYTLNNSIYLASHVTLKGEGTEKTILKKVPHVRTLLTIDADSSESWVTVEDVQGFSPGMGVTIMDQGAFQTVTAGPNVRTIERVEGLTLFLNRYLALDYTVERTAEVTNSFPLIFGYEVEDVRVEDLTVDGNRSGGESSTELRHSWAAIDFGLSKRLTIRNCVTRNYAGDGILVGFVEEPVIENCEAYGNTRMGIHLGGGALHGIVRHNRSHNNGDDGLYLCYRAQHGTYEENEIWANGRDGISIGHKDTDNLFLRNQVRENERNGIYFRNEVEFNAGHRNEFRENLIENNGRPGTAAYAVRIDGATRHITLTSNVIRETREGKAAVQRVAIYIGPQADHITVGQNQFEGHLTRAILDQSKSPNNKLDAATLRQASVD